MNDFYYSSCKWWVRTLYHKHKLSCVFNDLSHWRIVSNYNYSTADGQTITAQIPAYSGQLPSYISDNYSAYGDYQTAVNALASAPKPLDNSYVESYNNAKTAYTNYLRQQKSSGVTLNPVDEYLLK